MPIEIADDHAHRDIGRLTVEAGERDRGPIAARQIMGAHPIEHVAHLFGSPRPEMHRRQRGTRVTLTGLDEAVGRRGLGPAALDGEHREVLALDQIPEDAVLHAELLGCSVAGFTKGDDAGITDDAVEACEVADSVGCRNRIEGNRPRPQLGEQLLALLRAQWRGELGMAGQDIVDPDPGRLRRGPDQPPGAAAARPFVTYALFDADGECGGAEGVVAGLDSPCGDGGAIAVDDELFDMDRKSVVLGPLRPRGATCQESREIAFLVTCICHRVVGGQDISEIIEPVGFGGFDDASILRFDLSCRRPLRLRP